MIKKLKELRLKKKISQLTLAEAVGVSQQSVNKYENHKSEPEISVLIAMADYFGVTVDYLIGRTDGEGKNIRKTEAELMAEKINRLSENEKKCVKVIIDTFNNQKE